MDFSLTSIVLSESSQLNSLKTFRSTLALNDALRQQGSGNYFSLRKSDMGQPYLKLGKHMCVTRLSTCWLLKQNKTKQNTYEGQSLNIFCMFNLFRISLQADFFSCRFAYTFIFTDCLNPPVFVVPMHDQLVFKSHLPTFVSAETLL